MVLTDSFLEFFEATEEMSYHALWDVPLDSGERALISSLNVDKKKDLPKSTMLVIRISFNRVRVPIV